MTVSPIDLILGPQVPIGDNYFDQKQVERATLFGGIAPSTPPADGEAAVIAYDRTSTSFNLFNYYDMPQSLYNTWRRTGNPLHLANAEKAADAWWQHPQWIGAGTIKLFPDQATPPPRHAGIGGLILRALDGKPEYWPWIVAYTQAAFNTWLKSRIDYTNLYYGVREGAFALQYAVWVAGALPDSYPDAAGIRAQLLADAENVAERYFWRLQYLDGSWRWNTLPGEFYGPVLRGIMQPFQVGLLLSALIDLHLLTTNSRIKSLIGGMIISACRHLYFDGPYAKDIFIPAFGVYVRGFHYFYQGGLGHTNRRLRLPARTSESNHSHLSLILHLHLERQNRTRR